MQHFVESCDEAWAGIIERERLHCGGKAICSRLVFALDKQELLFGVSLMDETGW